MIWLINSDAIIFGTQPSKKQTRMLVANDTAGFGNGQPRVPWQKTFFFYK